MCIRIAVLNLTLPHRTRQMLKAASSYKGHPHLILWTVKSIEAVDTREDIISLYWYVEL